jgi:formate C-acetyltransferase
MKTFHSLLKGDLWRTRIDVADCIKYNITPYDGDASFLSGPSKRTAELWSLCRHLFARERAHGGVLSVDTSKTSRIFSHKPGYIKQELEIIVGLQTDKPLKRPVKPLGGIRVVMKACEEHGAMLDPDIVDRYTTYRKTHNDGVFDAYTHKMRTYRSLGIITGLPDNYARGRKIGDYRRVALYGVDHLIAAKRTDLTLYEGEMDDETIRLREEISEQIKALHELKLMAESYGYQIGAPAKNAHEAIQWTYFAYLAALKEHDGAAMSLGSVSNFFDIYITHDLTTGVLTEEAAQELIDQFVIKLRMVRHLRSREYDALFSGDPTWLTEAIGGCFENGQHKVTKTSYRFLQTLYNLGPSPEPNLTVLWSTALPHHFKEFCAKVSIETSSIQYENDDLMRPMSHCDDYGISCCVSQMKLGKQMQFFGARCNLAKALLLAINAGMDENEPVTVVDGIEKLTDGVLKYDEVMSRFQKVLPEVVKQYVHTMNVIHYMHDKYYYERIQMALHDSDVERVMAFGIAGLSVVADSLSAIRYAQVVPMRGEYGTSVDFSIEGTYPAYGNDDDRVDAIAYDLVKMFYTELKKHHIYRNAKPTLSVLTITSNVVYGQKTGATPDGRKAHVPFAPGANPMHGRDTHGAVASLRSVSKLPYEYARDGISNTFTITPKTLGIDEQDRIANLTDILGGYFELKGQHLNINVLDRATLEKAMLHPEEYPQLTIRVSGYAVNFIKLTKSQQQEVLMRAFFDTL